MCIAVVENGERMYTAVPCEQSRLRSSKKNREEEGASQGSVTFDLTHAQYEKSRRLAESPSSSRFF